MPLGIGANRTYKYLIQIVDNFICLRLTGPLYGSTCQTRLIHTLKN